MATKTLEQARQSVRDKFRPLIEAQRTVVLAAQNKLTEFEEQEKQALTRVQEYFDAVRLKPQIDATVLTPPDEAKDG